MLRLPSLSDLDGQWPKIFLYSAPCDMRWSFDRLAELARSGLKQDPLCGGLFLFRSRCRSRLKILYWDADGYALWYKRLEEGSFRVPVVQEGQRSLELKGSELAMLLSGIDLGRLKKLPRYRAPSPGAAR